VALLTPDKGPEKRSNGSAGILLLEVLTFLYNLPGTLGKAKGDFLQNMGRQRE
jgi:hypothetical protein